MEIEFREETIDFLQEKIVDGLYQEQTAEMTVPEELPAINRIVSGTIWRTPGFPIRSGGSSGCR